MKRLPESGLPEDYRLSYFEIGGGEGGGLIRAQN